MPHQRFTPVKKGRLYFTQIEGVATLEAVAEAGDRAIDMGDIETKKALNRVACKLGVELARMGAGRIGR